MTLTGINGTPYRVEDAVLSSGGEGDIHRVIGGGDKTVVKLYRAGSPGLALWEKLVIMKMNPPSAQVLTQVAWPLDILYDANKQFCGFVMPELNINAELGDVYHYPPTVSATLRQKIVIAQNICAVISEVHNAGYVFGDFNPRNIGVNTNTGEVAFLDTDTYHVTDPETGHVFRCTVCAPGYAAPELLEQCAEHTANHPGDSKAAYAKAPLPTFTKETDNFALAIHIFKLLMNGYTPFGGIAETASASQASPGIGDAAVRRDSYCFKPGNKPQSAAIPALDTLPSDIAELFTRAFVLGRKNPELRPSAREWHKALEQYADTLVTCPKNPLHQYDPQNETCPLCEADRQYTASIAPSMRQRQYQEGDMPSGGQFLSADTDSRRYTAPGRETEPVRAPQAARTPKKKWPFAAAAVLILLVAGATLAVRAGWFSPGGYEYFPPPAAASPTVKPTAASVGTTSGEPTDTPTVTPGVDGGEDEPVIDPLNAPVTDPVTEPSTTPAADPTTGPTDPTPDPQTPTPTDPVTPTPDPTPAVPVAVASVTYREAFPDENFRAYILYEVFDDNRNDDDIISDADQATMAGWSEISVGGQSISDLTGIEYFTAMTDLDCNGQNLITLDVSKNTALNDLRCEYNNLTMLDIFKNTALTYLDCRNNNLTTLDISKNTALTELSCGGNYLTTLDTFKNTALTYLDCGNINLTTLDISKNTALEVLQCGFNNLTTLDVSKNTALTWLDCQFNNLTTLDISKNIALTALMCHYNNLTTLDISKNTALKRLSCGYNNLTTLDVSKNTALTSLWCENTALTSLDVSKNTVLKDLLCDPDVALTGWPR